MTITKLLFFERSPSTISSDVFSPESRERSAVKKSLKIRGYFRHNDGELIFDTDLTQISEILLESDSTPLTFSWQLAV